MLNIRGFSERSCLLGVAANNLDKLWIVPACSEAFIDSTYEPSS